MKRCAFCGVEMSQQDNELGGDICADCCERYDECGVYYCMG